MQLGKFITMCYYCKNLKIHCATYNQQRVLKKFKAEKNKKPKSWKWTAFHGLDINLLDDELTTDL